MARPKTFDEADVLDRAADLFWDRGYEAVSVQDLVDHLGLSRSSLYDTFGDKHQLYLAALDRYRHAATDPLQTLIDELGSPRQAIETYLRQIAQDAAQDIRGCFVTNATAERAAHDQETGRRAADSLRLLITRFEGALRQAQDAGEVAPTRDARAIGRLLATTVYGLRVTSRIRPDAELFDDVAREALRVLNE